MRGFGQGNQNNNVDKGEFMDFRTLLRDTGFNPLGRTPGDGVTPYWDVRPGDMVPPPGKDTSPSSSPEPVNGTIFVKRVFAEVIKLQI